MIEQIHGVGLSGISGKTGKGIKNSLFGKLMLVLEQDGTVTAKGQGALQLGKGGKQTVFFDKGDPLLAAKAKHLLALATKAKHQDKPQPDDATTSLAAAHILIDATIQHKKPDKSGKAIIALQAAPVKGEQVTVAGKLSIQTSGSSDASRLTGKVSTLVQSKVIASDAVPLKAVPSKAIRTGSNISAAKSNNGPLLSGRSATETEQILQMVQQAAQGIARKAQSSVGMAAKIDGSGKSQAIVINEGGVINQQAETVESVQKIIVPLPGDTQKTNTTDKSNVSSAKKSAIQANVESAKALAGIHIQGNKIVQLQQAQPTTAGPAAASIAIASAAETSLADSGSQSSDKGSQDGRYISGMINETKISGSTTSTQTQFQQYLNGKATPSMTVFDSMNHIAQSAIKGKTKLEIQLEPANLGKIQISLQSDASKQLQIHMIVDQSATRAAIEQQLPQLKSVLAQQGFNLSGFSMGSQGQQTFSGQHSQGRAQHLASSSENIISPSTTIERRPNNDTGLSIRV